MPNDGFVPRRFLPLMQGGEQTSFQSTVKKLFNQCSINHHRWILFLLPLCFSNQGWKSLVVKYDTSDVLHFEKEIRFSWHCVSCQSECTKKCWHQGNSAQDSKLR